MEKPRGHTMENLSNGSINFDNCTIDQKNMLFVGMYSLVFVGGLLLNMTALVIFFRKMRSRSHTIVYMTNLALADLLLVCSLPVRIYYHLGNSGLPQWLCDIMGVFLLVNMYGSIFLLTCMSFDRCMAVCFPMSLVVKEGRKKAPLVCLGVWVLTVGASLPTYLTKKNVNRLQICFGNTPVYAVQPVAVAATLTVGFGIPLTTMLVCSWFLVRAITRSAAAQMDVIDSQKIRRMIAASLLIFLICFLPYHVSLGLLYRYSAALQPALCSFFHHSLLIACLNATLDPLAYYFTTETFLNKVDIENVRKMWPLHNQNVEKNHPSQAPLNT